MNQNEIKDKFESVYLPINRYLWRFYGLFLFFLWLCVGSSKFFRILSKELLSCPLCPPKRKVSHVSISLLFSLYMTTHLYGIFYFLLGYVRGYTKSAYMWLTLETLSKMQPASRIRESGLCLSFFKNVEKSPISIVWFSIPFLVCPVFGVSLRMFGHFSNMTACISSMECIDSSMELMAACVLMILSSACCFSLIKKSGLLLPKEIKIWAVFLIKKNVDCYSPKR